MGTPIRPALEFDDAFITGVDEIDSQHRNLIDLTNEAGVKMDGNATPDEVRELVRELLSYAIYHFSTEERLMQEYGYTEADAAAHIERHRDFSAKVTGVQEALQRHDYVDTAELMRFLANWITQHILGTDKHLATFILERRGD